jgi:hypothetical protein
MAGFFSPPEDPHPRAEGGHYSFRQMIPLMYVAGTPSV